MSAEDSLSFGKRLSVEAVEEGLELAPRFNGRGLIPVITTDAQSGEVLMLGYMNEEALKRSIITGEAHYWSRSRETLWRKGERSGFVQKIAEMRVDDDQDALWIRVHVQGGASCHAGYRSCFYRAVREDGDQTVRLVFREKEKVFDPKSVYGDLPNPTKL